MGDSPRINLEREKAVQRTCLEAIKAGLINSAHDCSEGGLAVALAECCILNSGQKIGAAIDLLPSFFPFSLRTDGLLFGETQSRIVITCEPENFNQIRDLADKNNTPLVKLGRVEGGKLIIGVKGKKLIDIGIDELEKLWRKGVSHHM
jgi:phosphoribosylformylglycinamidine synthase